MKDFISENSRLILPAAKKAVFGYVRKQFSSFFSIEEMEDMVSDVALRVWRARDRFDPSIAPLQAWVGTIGKNVVLTAAKAKRVRTDFCGHIEGGTISENCIIGSYRGDEFEADREILLDELQEDLFSRISAERDGRILADLIEGIDPKEIAEREGISVNAVYVIIFRLRKKLKPKAA